MLEWKRFAPPASESEVEQCEKTSRIRMPRCYRDYLLSSNGGQPSCDVVFQVDKAGESVMLGCLYGICNDEPGVDLEAVYEELKDDLPEGLFPIGEDPGGNLLLLATEGDESDAVYFWDRFGFLAQRFGKNLFRVAGDVEEFVASLQSAAEK